MRIRAEALSYERVKVKGVPGLFTDMRIVRESVPEGLFLYEVRYDDDNQGEPVQVAKGILVNFLGSLLTAEKLELPERGYLNLDPETDWQPGDYVKDLESWHNGGKETNRL